VFADSGQLGSTPWIIRHSWNVDQKPGKLGSWSKTKVPNISANILSLFSTKLQILMTLFDQYTRTILGMLTGHKLYCNIGTFLLQDELGQPENT